MSRTKFFERMRKEQSDAFDWSEELEGISTGSLAINRILGKVGGFPRGRISEVFGWESSGKTTVGLSACVTAQKNKLHATYIDMERGLDLGFAEMVGFDYKDPEKGAYLAPRSFEAAVQLISGLVEEVKSDIILVDSVAAMIPQAEIDGALEDVSPIAARARLLSSFLPKVAERVSREKVALVFINQMRMKVETGWSPNRGRPQEQSSGGSALRFYSSLRLDLKQIKKNVSVKKEMDPVSGKDIEVPIQGLHSATAIKNKVTDPYLTTDFYIRFDKENGIYGIDNLQTIIDAAVTQDIIKKKAGGHMSYTSAAHNFRLQGDNQLYLHLLNTPEVTTEIRQALKDKGLF